MLIEKSRLNSHTCHWLFVYMQNVYVTNLLFKANVLF